MSRAGKRWLLSVAVLAPFSFLAPGTREIVEVVRSEVSVRLAQREQLRITMAPTIVAQSASSVALPIRVEPLGDIPSRSFVRIRGLPGMVALTEGHSIGPGVWAVPLYALSGLKANIPTGVSGQSDLVIALVKVDGTVLAEATSALVVGPMVQMFAPSNAEPSKSGSLGPEREPQRVLSPEERERAITYLKKGDEQLAEGNFGTARLFYERAAGVGLVEAALALARTYDPNELRRLNERGVQPDINQAKRWYERARQLGATDIDQRLERLGVR